MGNTVTQWRMSIGCWLGGMPHSVNTLNYKKIKNEGTCSSPWFKLLVLLVLLVIGGVELNPGPVEMDKVSYQKMLGFANMTGELYEVKMSALLFLRALNTGHNFHLASNMESAGCFDDVILTLQDSVRHTVFLQLKHKQKEKSHSILKMSNLVHRKEFKLRKYIESCQEIRQCWETDVDLQKCGKFEDAIFIVYTNAKLVENSITNTNSANIPCIVSTGGKYVSFVDLLPKYIEVLRNKETAGPSGKQVTQNFQEDLKFVEKFVNDSQFVSQLYLCTEQLAESNLDDLIKEELRAVCGVDAVFEKFLAGIQNWWRSSNVFLTSKIDFWVDIVRTCAENIITEIPDLKIKFIDEEYEFMKNRLSSGKRFFYIKTDSVALTCFKVLQCLNTKLVVDVKTLETSLIEVMAVWRIGLWNVLVVKGEIQNRILLEKLCGAVNQKKSLIIVSKDSKQNQTYEQLQCDIFPDNDFSLDKLDLNSKHHVLERKVNFQGYEVNLNSLADESVLKNIITPDVVVQLLTESKGLQIGQHLDDLDPCYISRTLIRRDFVDINIFRETNIKLAVSGISSENELKSLLPSGEAIYKFNQETYTNNNACRFVIIDNNIEYNSLCGIHENIHWIHRCEGFLWMKSNGDISPVIKNLKYGFFTNYNVKEIIESPPQVVLVIADPGLGKSTEITHIARELKQRDLSTWVVKVDLNKYTKILSNNQVSAVELLLEAAILNNSSAEFQRSLFEYYIQDKGSVAVLCDGFDEISPFYSGTVLNFLKNISGTEIEKIFVTSRPLMKEELERNFCTLSYSLQPFTRIDQKNFLLMYWKSLITNSFELSKFIYALLDLVENSFNHRINDLTGIPLQTKMLAEVYESKALLYCQTGDVQLPERLDILELYQEFVDKKWEVYCVKMNLDINNAMAFQHIQSLRHEFQQSLLHSALITVLGFSEIRKFKNLARIWKENEKYIQNFKSGQDRVGIVTGVIYNRAVFIHLTFAEYFVALWFSNMLISESEAVKKIYLSREFEVVQKFLDRLLSQGSELHMAVLNEDKALVTSLVSQQNYDVNVRDNGGRTALNLAVMNLFKRKYYYDRTSFVNLKSIIHILLEHNADVNIKDGILGKRPLQLAVELRWWPLVEKLLNYQIKKKDLVLIKQKIRNQNPSKVGVVRGFILHLVGIIRARISTSRRERIANNFLSHIINISLENGYIKLIEFLLECGVCVQQQIIDRYGDNASMLYVAVHCENLEVIKYLLERGAKVNEPTCLRDRTPLTLAASKRSAVKIVELLIEKGACVNARDKHDDTALLVAASEGIDETVQILLKCNADVNMVDEKERTPLIWAVSKCKIETVSLLIEQGCSVNARDTNDNTALLVAARTGLDEIVQILLRHNAEVDVVDSNKRTPLIWAVSNCNLSTVKLLLEHGSSVNARDNYENTALLSATREGLDEIVELLLEHNVDINVMNGDMKTLLMLAVSNCNLYTVKLLIEHGSRNVGMDTGLLIAACGDMYEIIEEVLLNYNVDVNNARDE